MRTRRGMYSCTHKREQRALATCQFIFCFYSIVLLQLINGKLQMVTCALVSRPISFCRHLVLHAVYATPRNLVRTCVIWPEIHGATPTLLQRRVLVGTTDKGCNESTCNATISGLWPCIVARMRSILCCLVHPGGETSDRPATDKDAEFKESRSDFHHLPFWASIFQVSNTTFSGSIACYKGDTGFDVFICPHVV